MKKSLIAWFGCFVVMFGLSGTLTNTEMHGFNRENVSSALLRTRPRMALIVSGYALLALLMASLYPRVVRTNKSPVWFGAIFGVVAGLFWMLPYNLIQHGAYYYPPMALFFDPARALLEGGAGGVTLGLIYARFEKAGQADRNYT